ncbi:SDR family oxidoreductase [bacterium]|nr:SDR family oxidoreductase [bacterium]
MRLQGKVALVTGAGSGIGRGIAEAFVREGASVALADWSEPGGKESLAQIEAAHGTAILVLGDVSHAQDAQRMVDACIERFGRIDILVNNAGILRSGALHETDEQTWDLVLDVNLKSVYLLSHAALPHMLGQGKGRILNIASVAGLQGFEKLAAYCASKGAIVELTRNMAVDYSPLGINVNCIAPGLIATAMTAGILEQEASREAFVSQTPTHSVGQPEDIASAAVYLCSDESDFVTGEVLVIDGGLTVR